MIERGGTRSEGRIYLYDGICEYHGEQVVVKKKVLPDIEETIFRHIQRYYLPAFFLRKEMVVLDFPCGSGYGSEVLTKDTTSYIGMELDGPTIAYCEKIYEGQSNKTFIENDLTSPILTDSFYDLIACIEGIEHIEEQYQEPLIKSFYKALKPEGILVVSSPEKVNDMNKWHKHELTLKEFEELLKSVFNDVQILSHKTKLHNGTLTENFYGICIKGGV